MNALRQSVFRLGTRSRRSPVCLKQQQRRWFSQRHGQGLWRDKGPTLITTGDTSINTIDTTLNSSGTTVNTKDVPSKPEEVEKKKILDAVRKDPAFQSLLEKMKKDSVARRDATSSPDTSSSTTSTSDSSKDQPKDQVGGGRFLISYKCNACGGRSHKSISKQAYTSGVVLVECDHCGQRHLIADHLGWFKDKATTVESMMREKGQVVHKSLVVPNPSGKDADEE